MTKQNIILLSSALLFIAVIGGGAYVVLDKFGSKDATKTTKTTLDQPLEPAKINSNSTTDLSVKSALTINQPQTQQNTLPAPDEFSLYEQYADIEGIRYVDIAIGNGLEAAAGDTVAVAYSGWLTDGQMFDRSPVNEAGQIETFGFTVGSGQVIQGWDIGVNGMKEGGKRRLIIPSQLAYGENGAADAVIPPGAMLIFDVELAQVQKPVNN